MTIEQARKQRQAVGRWLRIKFEQDNQDTSVYRQRWGDDYEVTWKQLAADAEHSALLLRLLEGKEPDERF